MKDPFVWPSISHQLLSLSSRQSFFPHSHPLVGHGVCIHTYNLNRKAEVERVLKAGLSDTGRQGPHAQKGQKVCLLTVLYRKHVLPACKQGFVGFTLFSPRETEDYTWAVRRRGEERL